MAGDKQVGDVFVVLLGARVLLEDWVRAGRLK
jgi:hypothetical protein